MDGHLALSFACPVCGQVIDGAYSTSPAHCRLRAMPDPFPCVSRLHRHAAQPTPAKVPGRPRGPSAESRMTDGSSDTVSMLSDACAP